jgi:hypothetical protein
VASLSALALALTGGSAAAQRAPAPPAPAPAGAPRHVHIPSREELGAGLVNLQQKLDALADKLQSGERARVEALEQRLADLKKELEAPKNAAAPDLAARVDELAAAIDELKEDWVKKDDLRKYVRKPDEKQGKTVVGEELEVRGDWVALRVDDIDARLARLAVLGQDPNLSAAGQAILKAGGALGQTLHANDGRPRPRLMLRLYWETDRFIDDSTFLTAYAQPELELFVYPQDIDRSILARDYLAPRQRLGFIFKKAALGVQTGRVSLQVGVLQFTYGAGFFINPTNPFTPKNPLDPRREVDGVPAAKLDLALVQTEPLTLTFQAAAIARNVPNDLLGQFSDKLGVSGMAQLKADTPVASLTAIGIAQSPGDLGRDTTSFGGIVSTTPFGLTLSAEALWQEAAFGGDYQPELVVSLQGFTSAIGPSGTTYIVEYYHDGPLPGTGADAQAELVRGIERGDAFLVVDRLTRPLGRQNYLDLYLEPSLTQKLRVNLAGLIGLDEGFGAIVRGGFDWELYNFAVHAYGGVFLGEDATELAHHPIQAFADLAIFAKF